MPKTSMTILMSCFVRVMRVKTCCLLIMKILANTFSEANDEPIALHALPERPHGRSRLSVIHAEDDPHSTRAYSSCAG